MAGRLPDSPPLVADGATPPVDFDETLMRAIEAGQLDDSHAADPNLAGAFAAHQKLESLFAALRGGPADDLCRERPPWRSADAQWRSVDEPPAQLGRYQVRSTLGAGAFGTVYLARDPELNRDVAIKVSSLSLRERARVRADGSSLDPGGSELADIKKRQDAIATEARHAASLNHPHIVAIHDVGRQGERLYIVMEYIRGQTLERLLRDGPLPPPVAAELLAQIADALHYAHNRGFVHRDLKPANILLDDSLSLRERARVRADGVRGGAQDIGHPKIADFGLAITEDTQHTLAGQIAGTPEYMAPEQVRGESHRLDGRTDIWALGVILYELLAGRRPFAGQTTRAVLDEIEHRDPKPPRQIDDTIPAELERIILKCLAKRPTERYSTAGDVAVDLRRWLRAQSGGGTTARRALLAAAFILAACLGIFGWRATSAPPSALPQPLTGTIDVRLWNPTDPARRGLRLDEPGALPLRIGDQVRVEASVSEPSYVYIVWIGADGVAHPVYPWLKGDWGDRGTEKPIATLSLPDDPTLGWPMSGPPGTETLLLLARRSPLDSESNLRGLLQGIPNISVDDPRTPVRLAGGRVSGRNAESHPRAPVFNAVQRIDDSALRVERFLKERLERKFDLRRAIGFKVAKHSSESSRGGRSMQVDQP